MQQSYPGIPIYGQPMIYAQPAQPRTAAVQPQPWPQPVASRPAPARPAPAAPRRPIAPVVEIPAPAHLGISLDDPTPPVVAIPEPGQLGIRLE